MKKDKQTEAPSEEFLRFDDALKKILKVPKSEILRLEKEAKEGRKKEAG